MGLWSFQLSKVVCGETARCFQTSDDVRLWILPGDHMLITGCMCFIVTHMSPLFLSWSFSVWPWQPWNLMKVCIFHFTAPALIWWFDVRQALSMSLSQAKVRSYIPECVQIPHNLSHFSYTSAIDILDIQQQELVIAALFHPQRCVVSWVVRSSSIIGSTESHSFFRQGYSSRRYIIRRVQWNTTLIWWLLELTFWLFLLHQGPGKDDWFHSWEFRTWYLGTQFFAQVILDVYSALYLIR